MITLGTQVLTPYGFKEAWKLFEDDELLSIDSKRNLIHSTETQKTSVSTVYLEDGTSFDMSDEGIERHGIEVGRDLQQDEPIRFIGLEDESDGFAVLDRREGVDFGSFAKYEFIPHTYLMTSLESRQAFFEGLLYSQSLESKLSDGKVNFLVKHNGFADDLVYLVRSLGGNGLYLFFYKESAYYEVEVDLPKYFNEGVPKRLVSKIKDAGQKDTIKFDVDHDNFIINDFIQIPGRSGN